MPFLAPAFPRSNLSQYFCLLYLLRPAPPVFPLGLGLLQYLHHRSNLPCHFMLRYLQHYNLPCHLMLFRILPLLKVLLLRCRRSRSINQSNSQDFSVPGLDFFQILLLQKTCPSIQVMRSLPLLSIVNVTLDSGDLICDDSTESLRPLVPEVLLKPLFLALHNVSHPGVRGSRRLVSARFVWPGLSRDVGLWARSCLRCQQSKIQTHVKTSVPAILVPSRRFSQVHIDIVGPLPSSQGYSYLLTMINRTTHWPEAVPLSSISTESCVRAFISTWVSSFGVPSTLTSERGAQFTSSVWARVCRILGISSSQTTSFHPQSNGMIERFHRSLKSYLRVRASDSDWVSHLPLVMLGLRSVPKEDTGFSVSEAVYGSPLTIPGEFLDAPELPNSQFLSKMERIIAGFSIPPPHHVQHSHPAGIPAALRTVKFVFVREDASKPSLGPLYRGPYLVMEQRSKFFHLQIGTKIDAVSVDRLKPVISDCPVVPAAPPPRGHPPLRPSKHPPDLSSAADSSISKKKSEPEFIPRRNPHRHARVRSSCFALTLPFLLGGSTVAA